ncbi:MAG: M3 family metallopeptidase [Chloroflexota bacterium]
MSETRPNSWLLAVVAGLAVMTLAATEPARAAGPGVDWKWTPEQIEKTGAKVMKDADRKYAAIVAIPDGKRTFLNTVRAMERVGGDANQELNPPLFLKYVSGDEKIRNAGDSLEVAFSRWGIQTGAREDLYQALVAALKNDPPSDAVDKRLAEKLRLDFELNGLSLSKEKRDQVTALKQQISDIGIEFDTNLNQAQDSLLLTKAELAGMPDSYIERLDKAEGGRYKVTIAYPDFYPFMQNSTNADARRKLEAKFSNRASDKNLPLLSKALELRQQLAETMGYKTYADYATVDRMAKNPQAVMDFLNGLVAKLKPYRDADLATLTTLKQKTEGPNAGPIEIADWRYYDNQLKKTRYQVDPEEVRQYFPLDVVTDGLMSTYQKLFNVKFSEIKPATAWHPDVQLFQVADAKTGRLIGHFYLDLFPRPNKYGHAAAWSIRKGHMGADGKWQTPVSAMVCNFTKPTATDPSLLGHDEVETFFHEFGHVMHNLLTESKVGYFSGTSVYQDFVEAPSQMLENWVWNADVLQSLSGHYKDHSKKLPKELLDRMIAAKNLDNGLKYSRQAFFALTDMRYHSQPTANTTAVWHQGMKDVFGIAASDGTSEEGSFGHLFGYEAGYYSYLWSEVFAADMFSRFKREGVMNPVTGRAYRDQILAPGGTKEPGELLESFLGRKPNQDAFLEHIGVTSPQAAPAAPVGTN